MPRLLYLLIVSEIQIITNYPLNMYEMENDRDKYCLWYHKRYDEQCDDLFCFSETEDQKMSYCFRPVIDDEYDIFTVSFDFPYGSHPNFTFANLKEKNITSQMLLSFSSSINMAEQYQIYLDTHYHQLNSSIVNENVFYNCSSTWFGPYCRFQLDYHNYEYLTDEDQKIESFSDFVDYTFTWKDPVDDTVEVTCYIHLTCQSSLSCLDWREICDRKQDCSDGVDEKDCWQLELSHCSDDEYRCSNGECVPAEYIQSNSLSPACADRTDQALAAIGRNGCFQNPDFQCEERACRSGKYEFPCGDGQCISELGECQNGRHKLLTDNLCPSITLRSIELYEHINDHTCIIFCSKANCVKGNYSTFYTFRHLPRLFAHVRVMFPSKKTDSSEISSPNYVCYNDKLCPHIPPPTALFHGLACHQFSDLGLQPAGLYSARQELVNEIKHLFRGCLIIINETFHCNYSTMYQCQNSTKCISKYRLMDGVGDCPFHDDETYNRSCSLNDIRQRFKCAGGADEKCFTFSAMHNGKKECIHGEDEYEYERFLLTKRILFPRICNTFTDLLPLFIDGQTETDETGCDAWECNNTYSRCDGFWLCPNGADEMNCLPSNCTSQFHSCIFLNDTSKVSCLPIALAGNGIDDCLGGTDERTKYRVEMPPDKNDNRMVSQRFHCQNDTKSIEMTDVCNNRTECQLNDDETFCKTFASQSGICSRIILIPTEVQEFLCKSYFVDKRESTVRFKLRHVPAYPLQITMNNTLNALLLQTKTFLAEQDRNMNFRSSSDWRCNRGIPIRLQMTENTTMPSCLCPQSYYGDKCQYQNQRVSLSVRIRVASEWRSSFFFLVTLIDTDRSIESYDYFEFRSIRDCRIRFNIYLLYATRPKNASKSYFVQIDAFHELSFIYRASWIFPLRFLFLPVQHLSVLLRVPFSSTLFEEQSACLSTCVHGQCFHYVNDRNSTFCRCERGWTGTRCDVEYKCECASNSLCINSLICLCPPSRFGARCHLHQPTCDSKQCLNGGLCTFFHGSYIIPSPKNSAMCICPEGHVGEQCEHQLQRTRIDISFDQTVSPPPSVIIHLINVYNNIDRDPNRTTIAKKLQFDQYLLTVYTPAEFNIAIAQIGQHYYLIILSQQSIIAANVITKVDPIYRCRSLGEFFDSEFLQKHLLKRIKSYHIPCRQHRQLTCFYDDVHFCLCTPDRSANCFDFDHHLTYYCDKSNYCGDHGHCYQDDFTCPTSSFCTCDRCYFGSKCQFSTERSALSLDIILGYHIRSKTPIGQQPAIVKIAIVLTSIFSVVGIVNSLFSLQAFRGKEAQSVGCGQYLRVLSVVPVMTMILLVFKCSFLIASKIGWITSDVFLQIQCISMDFLVRSLVSVTDWLSVCVAIERVINVSQGARFNKRKSKEAVKWMVPIVFVCTLCSYIHDPIHRRVMNDDEEQRTWCLSEYSSFVQTYDRLLNIFHYFVPFCVNVVSAVIIIITAARTRSKSHKKKSFKELIHEQFRQHKHLLLSPLLLVVLALPRLILSLLPGCMGSPRESWLYLIGYFLAFVPSTLTFIVFVLPSDVYMTQFTLSMKRLCHR